MLRRLIVGTVVYFVCCVGLLLCILFVSPEKVEPFFKLPFLEQLSIILLLLLISVGIGGGAACYYSPSKN